jgi:hypothetical protein
MLFDDDVVVVIVIDSLIRGGGAAHLFQQMKNGRGCDPRPNQSNDQQDRWTKKASST